jgi:hypothetical protein
MIISQVLGLDSRGLLDPKHRGENAKVDQHALDDKDYEGVNSAVDSSKCTLFHSWGNPHEGYL